MQNDHDVHMSHCNQGEYAGCCAYGDDDCPALAVRQSGGEENLNLVAVSDLEAKVLRKHLPGWIAFLADQDEAQALESYFDRLCEET